MMLDKERLKLKVYDVLRRELTDEEFSLVGSITINQSGEEKRQEALYKEAQKEFMKEQAIANEVERQLAAAVRLQYLAYSIGVDNLEPNAFTISVAEYFDKYGKITDKQKDALLYNITKAR